MRGHLHVEDLGSSRDCRQWQDLKLLIAAAFRTQAAMRARWAATGDVSFTSCTAESLPEPCHVHASHKPALRQ